ncbi:MAG TPA: translation elongation factor Ts [bacterium]|nr:translation elongation factor Ts [bacterium]
MAISADAVKKLREKTGAGMMDCKRALEDTNGDFEKAVDVLRTKGQATSDKRASKATKEGLIGSYIHRPGGKIGVMVEINCETDFVARTAEFEEFARDIAMHVAASNPRYVAREEVPESVLLREREIYKNQALESGKPEKVIEKIVEGKVEKFYKEVCLLEQQFIKDTERTVQDLLSGLVGKTGEKIVIRRFVRFQVGEETEG